MAFKSSSGVICFTSTAFSFLARSSASGHPAVNVHSGLGTIIVGFLYVSAASITVFPRCEITMLAPAIHFWKSGSKSKMIHCGCFLR